MCFLCRDVDLDVDFVCQQSRHSRARTRESLVHLEHGGTHDKDNLTTLCDGHHVAHHDGRIVIRGPAPDIEVVWVAEVPHVGDPGAEDPAVVEQVRSALRNLGLTRAEAAALVERAVVRVGDTDVEPLLRAALREYPRASS